HLYAPSLRPPPTEPETLCLHDALPILDHEKICVRAGHHCAQLIHDWLGITSSVRASLMFYNNEQDIDRFIQALKKAKDFINVLLDRKSTRLNSSHVKNSYAVFCLKTSS